MSTNAAYIEEIKQRLQDRYTAAELVELLDLETAEIVDVWWDFLLEHRSWILKEVGVETDDD